MVDNWIDRIELCRDAYANFSVWGSKYGGDPLSGTWHWFDWNKTKRLKNPMAIHAAIEEEATYRDVQVEWVDAIPLIASIDWLTAAVIARHFDFRIPELPAVDVLLTQRALRSLGPVRVGAEWGHEVHEIVVSYERWLRILCGEPFRTDAHYWYEGRKFTAVWFFTGDHRLVVSYDGCGVHWDGCLDEIDFIAGPTVDDVDLARVSLDAMKRSADAPNGPITDPDTTCGLGR
jgi:hypothetical protein